MSKQGGVNAHVYTNNKKVYYWTRLVIDPTYGTSGFVYVTQGDNTYFVLPDSVNFMSANDVIITCTVPTGILTLVFDNSDAKLTAGYHVTKDGKTIDSSPMSSDTIVGDYIKLISTK